MSGLQSLATLAVAGVAAYVAYKILGDGPIADVVNDFAGVIDNTFQGGGTTGTYDPTNPQQREKFEALFGGMCIQDGGFWYKKDGYEWCWGSNHGNARLNDTTGVPEWNIPNPPAVDTFESECRSMNGEITKGTGTEVCTLRNKAGTIIYESEFDIATGKVTKVK